MSSLQNSLAYDAALASFRQNRNYRSNDSIAEATALLAAIDELLVLRPRRSQFGGVSGESVEFDFASLRLVRDAAYAWLQSRRLASDPVIGYVDTQYIQE